MLSVSSQMKRRTLKQSELKKKLCCLFSYVLLDYLRVYFGDLTARQVQRLNNKIKSLHYANSKGRFFFVSNKEKSATFFLQCRTIIILQILWCFCLHFVCFRFLDSMLYVIKIALDNVLIGYVGLIFKDGIIRPVGAWVTYSIFLQNQSIFTWTTFDCYI